MAKPNVQWPLKGTITVTGPWANSPAFYAKYGQKGHNGLDLRAKVGTPVYATDAGTIDFEGWGQNDSRMGGVAGICCIVKHSWGYSGYAHLSRTVINRGQKVKKGQLIGYSGATGGITGAHLHYETLPKSPKWNNGFAGRVNPSSLVTIRAFGWKAPVTSTKPVAKKSIATIAAEVWAGKWGNGQDRINRLKKAGYDPAAVQRQVNKGNPKKTKKTVAQIAAEIWAGKGGWGNGATRVKKLKAAGYNPAQVQAEINKRYY